MNAKAEAREDVLSSLLGHIGGTTDHLKTEKGATFVGVRWLNDCLYFDFVKEGGGIAACYWCRATPDGKGIEFKETAIPIQDLTR
jgi:hypothetical protein